MVLMSTPGEVLMSNTYVEWCYSHHGFVFLHYHITSFPGLFENMVKKLEEASDGESRRDLAGSAGANTCPWERTLTHCHTALCSPPCPVCAVGRHRLRQGALNWTQHCDHCFTRGSCCCVPALPFLLQGENHF